MNQPGHFGEFAPYELKTDIGMSLSKYSIDAVNFDDVDRLRSYLVILDLDRKSRDLSGWFLGFLICASIWSLRDNGPPFEWFSTLFGIFGWSRTAIDLCNLILLVALWIGIYLIQTKIKDGEQPCWRASNEELENLRKRIQIIADGSTADYSSGTGSPLGEEYDMSPAGVSSNRDYLEKASKYYGNGPVPPPKDAIRQQWRVRCDNGIDVIVVLVCPQCNAELSVPIGVGHGLEPPTSISCNNCHQTIWATLVDCDH